MLATPVVLVAADLAEAVSADLLYRLFLVLALTASVATLFALGQPREWSRQLTDRLLYGVPWGTLIVMVGLLAVFYGLQDGASDTGPIVLPFRAWSYLDPFGIVVAGFAHSSTSHLMGNLIGTLVLGSFAEFIWGHHTPRRTDTVFHELWTHPVARAVGVFPAVVVALTIVGTAVALGPIIGFSIVVFAFAGFTVVRYPLATVIATVGQTVLSQLLNAIKNPETVTSAGSSFSTPWFASIALQGHAIGLLFGILLGLGLLRYRSQSPPSAARVWLGVLFFSIYRSLWAVYWFRGENSYVLYRAVGVGLVFLLAAMVTYAVVARHRPVLSKYAVENPQSMLADMTTISHRQVALLIVVAASASLVTPAIAANATTAADAELPGEPIEIRGYELTYGENVTDGQINVFDVDGFGETTRISTSGVIVRNTDRHIWSTAVSTARLADSGEAKIRLGGVGWQETVTATREGWQATGGGTTYRVLLSHDNTTRLLYASDAVEAEPVIVGQRVSINATDDGFRIGVDNETAPLPTGNESTTLGRLEFTQQDDRLVAIHDRSNTAVRVATKAN
ncbi:rhomboid family intramembrane serine protease [Halonotius terrestris]|uniref:Rhomboid family intramembrane serine protease n=1 Tax=Halonotius terrestris TaxID=2487750 RepID=A0A8J8PCZ1_9EURY|nr:rhomboid family intramembrane serine protease [Halonotius terrestris]TQQ82912.1 rhomboid family intramembrane serine protease [Halonotius terrestris]